MKSVLLALVVLLLYVPGALCVCDGTNCNSDHGVCVADDHCACWSGWFGGDCATETVCNDWKAVDPLATSYVPVLHETESKIEAQNLILHFDSPVVTERYNYRVLIGGHVDNVCDSWTPSVGWTHTVAGCNVNDDGVLSWDDVHHDCGWSDESTDDLAVYKNTIYFRADEDLSIIQRKMEWDYNIKVSIPRTVQVTTIDIKVHSPEDLVSAIYKQDVDPSIPGGIFRLITRLAWPYMLYYQDATIYPNDMTNGFALHDQNDCTSTEDSLCDQLWVDNFLYDATKRCDVTGTYKYHFYLNCRPGYTPCPYENYDVYVEVEVISENFCLEVEVDTDISATMESYQTSAHSNEQESGFLTTDTAYFLVDVTSDQLTLHESEVVSVYIKNVATNEVINMMIDRTMSLPGSAAGFAPTKDMSSPYFQFELSAIPTGVYDVYAKVAVTYAFEVTGRRSQEESVFSLVTRTGIGVDEQKNLEAGESGASIEKFGSLFACLLCLLCMFW